MPTKTQARRTPRITRPANAPAIPPTIAPVLRSLEVEAVLVELAAEDDEDDMGVAEPNELARSWVARACVGIKVEI